MTSPEIMTKMTKNDNILQVSPEAKKKENIHDNCNIDNLSLPLSTNVLKIQKTTNQLPNFFSIKNRK